MKKKHGIFFGFALLFMAAIFAFTGCPTDADDDDDKGTQLPASKGANALSEKMYFEEEEKTVFSATGEDSGGTYSVYDAEDDNGSWTVGDDGKFIYQEIETGAYSWNEEAKTVTLAPEKVAPRDNGLYGPLQTKSESRKTYQKQMEAYKEEMGEEEFNKELKKVGFSSLSAYLDYYIDIFFSNKTYAYSFSADAKSLFLDETLPKNRGDNEFAGQTWYGTTWNDDNDQYEKDTNKVYTFKADGTYSFMDSTTGGYKEPDHSGTYAYYSSMQTVFLRPESVNGKTREAYYTELTPYTSHEYPDDDIFRAARTNGAFGVRTRAYDSSAKTIR